MGKPKHRFVIRYQSGAEVPIRADGLTVTSISGAPTRIEWDNMWPRPMVLGIHNVESIWQVK